MMTSKENIKAEIFHAERQDDQLTLLFGDGGDSKSFFTITHTKPRDYRLAQSKIRPSGTDVRFEFSETGKFIYTADQTRIYIYNRDKQEPIFTYERGTETRLMSESMPQFIHDQTVVFTTSQYAIGFDLQNEKKLFQEEC